MVFEPESKYLKPINELAFVKLFGKVENQHLLTDLLHKELMFTKEADELCTTEECWIYFLKHAHESNEIPTKLIERLNWDGSDLYWHHKLNEEVAISRVQLEAACQN